MSQVLRRDFRIDVVYSIYDYSNSVPQRNGSSSSSSSSSRGGASSIDTHRGGGGGRAGGGNHSGDDSGGDGDGGDDGDSSEDCGDGTYLLYEDVLRPDSSDGKYYGRCVEFVVPGRYLVRFCIAGTPRGPNNELLREHRRVLAGPATSAGFYVEVDGDDRGRDDEGPATASHCCCLCFSLFSRPMKRERGPRRSAGKV